jgi:endoglycosylceramidase
VGSGGKQSLVKDARTPPEGDNVKTDKLAVLARPYPQAVAGTPERFDFDRDSRRLEVEWSTARVGSGSFGPRSVTEIWVGSRHYPNGYEATVTGGQVISTPGAEVLRVHALRGSSHVSVTVAPG